MHVSDMLSDDPEQRARLQEEEENMTEQDRTKEAQKFDAAIGEGEENALVVATEGPSRLLEIAVQQDLDIDKLERLVAMKERWDAQEARKAFYEALSKFQKLVPTLKKDKHVHYVTKSGAVIDYDHTSLGKIQPQIQEAAAECGLSHRWEFNDGPDLMEVTCVITHVDGHSERSSQSAPIDTSGNKSTIHGRQSSRTYLERSTLIGALGLMSADKDDDGRQGQVSAPTPKEATKDLPDLPEGTDTKAPRPETIGKTDADKQKQLYGYLCEITGVDPKKERLLAEEKKRLSDELIELTTFESDGEIKKERSLRNLKGKWLNTAIGKAKDKIKKVHDELAELLKCPALTKEFTDGMEKEIAREPHDLPWYKDQIVIIKEMIADKEKENECT
ncbi:MAG: hypothetical protein E3J60_04535 [Dehalococcoidia bacterium]|nr:MAG: hypothetical protein E3J60_04535 [Dehalococcoidia bacterium]